MNKKISPSMMCADYLDLRTSIKELERGGADYLHIDVMDGVFVPNYALGTDYIKAVRAASSLPLDIHLMIDRPEDKLNRFDFCGGDYVSIHWESSRHIHRAIDMIRGTGAKPVVALNPATPLCVLEEILPDVDAVLIMTVNPGYAGQALISGMIEKIKRLRAMLDGLGLGGIGIEVDGNVSVRNAKLMSEAGADIFVAGSSGCFFGGNYKIYDNMIEMRRVIG